MGAGLPQKHCNTNVTLCSSLLVGGLHRKALDVGWYVLCNNVTEGASISSSIMCSNPQKSRYVPSSW